jgi:hypothetical protein
VPEPSPATLPPNAAVPQPAQTPGLLIPGLWDSRQPKAAHPASAPAQHVLHLAEFRAEQKLPHPKPALNSAPPAPTGRTQLDRTPAPPAPPVPQPAHYAQLRPQHPPREPPPAPPQPATRCSSEPWHSARQPAPQPLLRDSKQHADFPHHARPSSPPSPADRLAACDAPPDAGSLPASMQQCPMRTRSSANQMGQMNPEEDSPICSKPDSLLSQQQSCGYWPEAAIANMTVRATLAPKRKSRREKRFHQTNTCRSGRNPRGVRNRLFFAARAVGAASYLRCTSHLCYAGQ